MKNFFLKNQPDKGLLHHISAGAEMVRTMSYILQNNERKFNTNERSRLADAGRQSS